MKTYQEMIEFTAVAGENRIRYNTWVAVVMVAETYGVPEEQVYRDLTIVQEQRQAAAKQQRREKNQARHRAIAENKQPQ